MSAPLLIFKSINSSSQQQELLQKLLSISQTVSLRLREGHEVHLKPMSINSALEIKCQYAGSDFSGVENSVILMNFTLGNEPYLSEVVIEVRPQLVLLKVQNLFHLQRRRHFRYILPPNHPGSFKVTSHNKAPLHADIPLIDISTEGCALRLPTHLANLSVGDQLEGEIILEAQKGLSLHGEVLNMRESDGGTYILGLRFNHLPVNRESDIIQAISLLQRQLFLKRSA